MLCHGALLGGRATLTQIYQEWVVRGQEGILIDHLQSRPDGDRCMMVVVKVVAGDIWTIVDPKNRFSIWAISHSKLNATTTRLQSLDQPS